MQLIPTYLPSINYMSHLVKYPCIFSTQCNYQKQTHRNRSYIYGANGKLGLTIPIHHTKKNGHQKDCEVRIKWEENWQKQHWKSLESAYRSSPFFEFYEDDLKSIFFVESEFLMDYNYQLIENLCDWLEVDFPNQKTNIYQPLNPREEQLILAKNKADILLNRYPQVFETKHGFISNLSILDLLFNLGPESSTYLNNNIH